MYRQNFVILHPADAIQTDYFCSRRKPLRQLATRYKKTTSRNDAFYHGVALTLIIVRTTSLA